jgi:hypothetical protein
MKQILTFFLLTLSSVLCAQNSWNLTIAFEDATGAKDTLRIFWDEDASLDEDISLGEFPINPDTINGFRVAFHSISFSTSQENYYKSIAAPWSWDAMDGFIYAYDHVEPVTITYDSNYFNDAELFPFLDSLYIRGEMHSNYFFFGPLSEFPCDCLDMEDHDTIVLDPNWPTDHFPIYFIITRGVGDPLNAGTEYLYQKVKLYPNPTLDAFLNIEFGQARFTQFEVWDMQGRQVLRGALDKSRSSHAIDINDLPVGSYVLKLFDEKGESVQKRFVKSPK